jgi:LDH2 family malate/lactate/ureidoglycolate dehydrogenase
MRLSWYLGRLRAGVCDPKATPEVVVDGGAIAVLDGNDAMGQIVAARAAELAVARAKAHGIGAVGVRRSYHFGTALYYTLMAARQSCVGFLSTNASPAMAPWGGRSKMVGTNPWSWAAPAGRHAPMALDMANTAVARGKIYVAGRMACVFRKAGPCRPKDRPPPIRARRLPASFSPWGSTKATPLQC